MNKKALVSIVIPTYNRAHLLNSTLDRILNQTYAHWECILVDDESKDKTKQIINSYIQQDKRFRYYVRPKTLPKGANVCRNFGFTMAKGLFINWFDSDDLMEPSFLQEKVSAFECNTDAVLHRNRYSNYALSRFRESKFMYSRPEDLFDHYALDDIEIQTCGFMWKSEFLKNKQLFDESIERFQDNEFHSRMLALKPEVIAIDKVLATIRGGDGDSSQISARTNLTKKKLHDIFYYRQQTLKLNQKYKGKAFKKINKVVSKKALWAFYDALRFEKKMFKRFVDLKNNYGELITIYSNTEITSLDKMKSYAYILYILFFNGVMNRKK